MFKYRIFQLHFSSGLKRDYYLSLQPAQTHASLPKDSFVAIKHCCFQTLSRFVTLSVLNTEDALQILLSKFKHCLKGI